MPWLTSLSTILHISRPRFWLYTAGPFFIGSLFGLLSRQAGLIPAQIFYAASMFFFFLIPTNILIYGVNDLFDRETDQANPKKGVQEHKISTQELHFLQKWVISSAALSFIVMVFQPALSLIVLGLSFLFLAIGYSMPPLRFKARYFFDSFSNGFYIVPGIMAYLYFTGQFPSLLIIVATWCWAMAMHLYSAIPDIAYDKSAKVITSAVVLGERLSLLTCVLLWGIFVGVILQTFGVTAVTLLFLVYPAIPVLHLIAPVFGSQKLDIAKIYWLFPYITTLLGAVVSILLLTKLFS